MIPTSAVPNQQINVITSNVDLPAGINARPVTSSNFDNKVLIEQVRCIESQQALANESEKLTTAAGASYSFDDRLLQRARHLVRQQELKDILSHAPGVWRLSNIFAGVLAVMLGAMASLYAVSGGSTINIYWLLLVLVGFNFLSMMLWVLGVSTGMDSLITGVLSKASAWLPTALGRRQTSIGIADRAWLRCHIGGAVGKWRLSQVTQQLWLLYLCTGLAVLVLSLMARQFDFVWGTTLLSNESFVRLTSMLGQPLHALGFTIPSEQQVMETRIGAGYALNAAHRYGWAQFLIGSLLMFGILPRLILWVVCRAMLGVVQRHFALDYYLPYYIHLRQELMPMHGRSEIVDADTSPPASVEDENPALQARAHTSQLPAGVSWVAVELGDDVAWPLATIGAQNNLGQVVDRASLDDILQRVRNLPGQNIAIAVTAGRPPDRGLKRTVSSLCSAAAGTSLVLIEPGSGDPISNARLTAWYRLAQECSVPAENVVLITEG